MVDRCLFIAGSNATDGNSSLLHDQVTGHLSPEYDWEVYKRQGKIV